MSARLLARRRSVSPPRSRSTRKDSQRRKSSRSRSTRRNRQRREVSRSDSPRRSSQRRESSAASGANRRVEQPQSSSASGANRRVEQPQFSAANCAASRPFLQQFHHEARSAQRRADIHKLGVDVMNYVWDYLDAIRHAQTIPKKQNGDVMALWHYVSNAYLRDGVEGGKNLFRLIDESWEKHRAIPLALASMEPEDYTRPSSRNWNAAQQAASGARGSSQRREQGRYSTNMHPCDEKKYQAALWQIRGDLAWYQGEVRTWSFFPERWYRLENYEQQSILDTASGVCLRESLGKSNYQFGNLDCDRAHYKAINCTPNFNRPISCLAVEDNNAELVCLRSVKCTTFGEVFYAACEDFTYYQIMATWQEGRIVLTNREGGSNRNRKQRQ